MTLTVEMNAGVTFQVACREAQSLMAFLPPVRAVRFTANGVDCTVYGHTNPDKFAEAVQKALDKKLKYVIDQHVH